MGKRSRQKKERRVREETKPHMEKPENTLVSVSLNIIRWGTYLALFTPLVISSKFFFPFVGPKSLYFMGLVEIIFFTWLFLIFHSPRYRPRLNPLLISLILFLIVLILSSSFGANPSYSFWSKPERMTGLLMWFHLLALFLVISSVFQKSDWIKIFSISILVGVILSSITFISKNPSMRGGATIGNSSFLGTYLLFCLFFALYLIFISRREIKIYSGICFLIIFLALFLSGARAAQLSFLGGLVLLFFLYLTFIPQKSYLRFLGKILLICSLLFFLISSFFIFQPDNIIHQKFIEKATQARLVVWEKAWKGFLDQPGLGWGPENFEFVFTKYFNPCMFLSQCGGEIWFDRAHNILFDTLVTTGIFGFLTYMGIFLSTFYILWKNYFQKNIEFWTAGIFSTLLISYSVQNLTVFDMVSSYLTFFLVLGLVGSIAPFRERPPFKKPISLKPWFSLFILILFIFSFFKFVIQPLRTDYYVIAALKSPPASERRLNFYQKALTVSSLGKYQIRDFFGQTTLNFTQSKKAKQVSVENLKKEIIFVTEELEKTIKESPLDFRSHLKLGQVYNVLARFDVNKLSLAQEVLEKAIELSPTNQQGYWALAQTKIFQGDFQAAFSLAEKAKDLEPRLRKSYVVLIQIAKIIGNDELAQEKIKEASKVNPRWESWLRKILED